MERDRELDNAETRAEMASGHRYGIDGFPPELRSELNEVPLRQRPQILRRAHLIQQRRFRSRRRPHLSSPAPFVAHPEMGGRCSCQPPAKSLSPCFVSALTNALAPPDFRIDPNSARRLASSLMVPLR